MQAAGPQMPAGPCSEPGTCRAREILERVGDKWSLQVIFHLRDGPLRFTALRRGIDGISQRMLTVTLRGLERDGIISRTMYPRHAASGRLRAHANGRHAAARGRRSHRVG